MQEKNWRMNLFIETLKGIWIEIKQFLEENHVFLSYTDIMSCVLFSLYVIVTKKKNAEVFKSRTYHWLITLP